MLLGRRCGICGRRGWRKCGARSGETIWIGGGFYEWRKFNPCSEATPGGLAPDVNALPACGDLDEVRRGGY